jgi:hypothetical protein
VNGPREKPLSSRILGFYLNLSAELKSSQLRKSVVNERPEACCFGASLPPLKLLAMVRIRR